MNIGLIEKGFRYLSPLMGIILLIVFANLMYKPKMNEDIRLELNESLTCIILATVSVLSGWGIYYLIRGLVTR